jgi:hypothetical protein
MASIAPVNPGVTDVLQLLSGAGSASVASALSSTAVQSALQKASPTDLVQLSAAALQLQDVSDLFGGSGSSPATAAASPESQLISDLFGANSNAGAGSSLSLLA